MDIQNITHTCSKTADCKVDTTIQPLQWFPVGTESTLAPGIITIDAGAAQQTEGQLVVCWQTVLCAKVERSCQSGSTATLVAQILQVDEVGNLVAVVIYLVINGRTTVFSYRSIMEAIELEALSSVHSLHIVAPVDEAQIENRSTQGQVVVQLIDTTEVECHTEAAQSCAINIYIINLFIFSLV